MDSVLAYSPSTAVREAEKQISSVKPAVQLELEQRCAITELQFTALVATVLQCVTYNMASKEWCTWLSNTTNNFHTFQKRSLAERLVTILSCELIADVIKQQDETQGSQPLGDKNKKG